MLLIIFIAVMCVILAAALWYLAGRVSTLSVVQKILSKYSERAKKWMCFGLIVVINAILWITMGLMNVIVCMLHFVVFWLIADGIALIVKKITTKKINNSLLGGIVLIGTCLYLCMGYYFANHVWETDYTLATDKPVGNLRIVQFTDSHIGATFHGEELAQYIERMQAANPDIVVITGDFVDDDTSKEDMIAACEALQGLHPTYGVYYVYGNHDKGYYGDDYRGYSGADLARELEKNGVVILEDEHILIDNRFYIVGRQDRSEEQKGNHRADMNTLVKTLEDDKYVIVLDHQPHDYAAQTEAGVDLVLSGHTHGGQLIPINWIGEWSGANDKNYGLETRKHTNFIVSSGIADWAIKFKTGCKSEYVVIDIQGK